MLGADRSPSGRRCPTVGARRCASAEQARADADQRRALLDRDAPVLRRPHRQLVEPVLAPPSSRSRRNHGRDASGSSASGGIVISPRIDGYRSSQPGELVRRHARLGRLAGEVHLEERGHRQPPGGGVGVERVDELADAVDDLDLVRLQVPDEVPAERRAVSGVLRARGPGRGSRPRPRPRPRRGRPCRRARRTSSPRRR